MTISCEELKGSSPVSDSDSDSDHRDLVLDTKTQGLRLYTGSSSVKNTASEQQISKIKIQTRIIVSDCENTRRSESVILR